MPKFFPNTSTLYLVQEFFYIVQRSKLIIFQSNKLTLRKCKKQRISVKVLVSGCLIVLLQLSWFYFLLVLRIQFQYSDNHLSSTWQCMNSGFVSLVSGHSCFSSFLVQWFSDNWWNFGPINHRFKLSVILSVVIVCCRLPRLVQWLVTTYGLIINSGNKDELQINVGLVKLSRYHVDQDSSSCILPMDALLVEVWQSKFLGPLKIGNWLKSGQKLDLKLMTWSIW